MTTDLATSVEASRLPYIKKAGLRRTSKKGMIRCYDFASNGPCTEVLDRPKYTTKCVIVSEELSAREVLDLIFTE